MSNNLLPDLSTVRAILFDLGRVLVHIDFDAFPNALGLRTAEERRLYAAGGLIEEVAGRYETGRISTERFLEELATIFKGKFTREQLLGAWNAIIQDQNEEIVPIVEELWTRYDIGILSNTSESHFAKALRTSSIVRKFPYRFLSYEIGAMKPDPRVYRHVIESLKIQPSAILFVDDIPSNIEAAVESGIQGLLFRGADKLITTLKDIGVTG